MGKDNLMHKSIRQQKLVNRRCQAAPGNIKGGIVGDRLDPVGGSLI